MGKHENPGLKLQRQARYRERNRENLQKKQQKYRDREKKEKFKKPSPVPVFCGIDGEAHREADGRSVYSFLRAGGMPPLVRREGLGTREILEYLFTVPAKTVICGFVLNYDWENWLRDISDDAYRYLTGDTEVEPAEGADWFRLIRTDHEGRSLYVSNTIRWQEYTITYYPKKIFSVEKPALVLDEKGRPFTRRRKVQDVWGYCQSSFLKACKDWGVANEEELAPVAEGKAKRDVFSWDEIEYIIGYNYTELELMAKLAAAIYAGIDDACRLADLPVRPSSNDLYGPGAIARKMLKKTGWPVSLGRKAIPEKFREKFLETADQAEGQQKIYLTHFPIISSYYGGRIEAAGTGRIRRVYDYDLHSAYPSAIVRLPVFSVRPTWKRFLDPDAGRGWAVSKRAVGMYYVMWNFPAGWMWYPFPTRQKKYQNVFYPRNGQGWIASPELFAALDSIPDPEKYIKVYYAWTVPGLYSYGGGERLLPDALKSEIAILIERMYNVRAEAKAKGLQGAQLALKLVLNSLYGKLLQQIGMTMEDPGFFHDLVASWITSWTRAMIWRAIAPHRAGKTVLAVQTDGIVTKKPLDLLLSPALADWEMEELPDYRQLLPGLYDYEDGKGGRKVRRRGFPNTFDFEKAWAVMDKPGRVYPVKFRTFLGRRLYLAQPYEYKNMLYQWPEMEKTFRPDLGAKRGNPLGIIAPGMKFGDCYLIAGKERWLPPKTNTMQGPGLPFVLKFEEPSYIPKEEWEIEQAALEDASEESLGFFRE